LTISSSILHTSYFEITIKDTGSGIPKESLKHIFEPFYSKKEKGTGLGLSISHSIVTNHKGKLLFETVEGKYTKVMVDLPIHAV